MYSKLSQLFIIPFVIFVWVLLINSSDQTTCQINDHCPPGTYSNRSSSYVDICCDCCSNYLSFNESCNATTPCSPSLKCNMNSITHQTCTYKWTKSFNYDCEGVSCPTILSCPDAYFLVRSRSSDECCDECFPYSQLGGYCDRKQKCYSRLECKNNVCEESRSCNRNHCKDDVRCAQDQYLVQKDGLEYCCDTCEPYRDIGDQCNDCMLCDPGLYCNQTASVCQNSTWLNTKSPQEPCIYNP